MSHRLLARLRASTGGGFSSRWGGAWRVLRWSLLVTVAALLWWLLTQSLAQARQQWQQQQRAASQLAALQREWQQLQRQVPRPGVPLTPLADLVRTRAQALGLAPQEWRIEPQGAGVTVRGEVDFDAWLQLLADLQMHAAVHVTRLQLDASAPGRVHVQALLVSHLP